MASKERLCPGLCVREMSDGDSDGMMMNDVVKVTWSWK